MTKSTIAYETPRLLISSPESSAGKTTVTCALLGALMSRFREGKLPLAPSAVKCGPDFIDPMFHRFITKRECGNIDLFFTPPASLKKIFALDTKNSSVVIIEGAMGFYDGENFTAKSSASQIADLLKAPVLLVVNAEGKGFSICAEIAGFCAFSSLSASAAKNSSPQNPISAVILNKCSPKSYAKLAPAIEQECNVKCAGFLENNPAFKIPSRHLGLFTPDTAPDIQSKLTLLSRSFEKTCDTDMILRLASKAPPFTAEAESRILSLPEPTQFLPDDFQPTSARAEKTTPPAKSEFHADDPQIPPAQTDSSEPPADTKFLPADPQTFPANTDSSAPHSDPEFLPADPQIPPANTDSSAPPADPEFYPADFQPRFKTKIAFACDAAFCFYYRENLDLLAEFGAKIVRFSPLNNEPVPQDASALYIPGGYPELFFSRLAENTKTISSIKEFAAKGAPIFAECGGFLYLQLAGVLSGSFKNEHHAVRFGYITLEAQKDTFLCSKGDTLKAHEFHHFDSTENGTAFSAVKTDGQSWKCVNSCAPLPGIFPQNRPPCPFLNARIESENIIAGFPHFYFPSNKRIAENFVTAALLFESLKSSDPPRPKTPCPSCSKCRACRTHCPAPTNKKTP